MNDTTSFLTVRDLTVTFRSSRTRKKVSAVDGVDLFVDRGEIVALVGESGSGKSTIARVIAGLQKDYTGRLELLGAALGARRTKEDYRNVQMIFQDPYASLDPLNTVEQILAELLRHHGIARSRQDIRERSERLLDDVRLPREFLERRPAQMSGGQRQRVSIARALALSPALLIADEATAALDVSVQAEIIELLGRLRDEWGLSILFISHDLANVSRFCDRVYVIHNGKFVESGETGAVFSAPQAEYTKKLIRSIPVFHSAYLDELSPHPKKN